MDNHVQQAGSSNNDKHLRFDFTHFSPMTPDEIRRVEDIVNEEIDANLPVLTKVMDIDEAKKTGAMALFGEKYDKDVRVVSMGDFSKELCGGTHVSNTGAIRAFKIISEGGVAAGVRRIEALTGDGVFKYYAGLEQELKDAAHAAKCEPSALVKRIEALNGRGEAPYPAENEKLKNKMAREALGDVMDQVQDVKGTASFSSQSSRRGYARTDESGRSA